MKNTQYSNSDVLKRCKNKLNIKFRCKKEYNGWYTIGDKKITRITIPKTNKPISAGLYKGMADDLLLSISQFDQFLDCPLTGDLYYAHILTLI